MHLHKHNLWCKTSNGVILITTGKVGKTTINYGSYYYGTQTANRNFDVYSGSEFAFN
jgi:hypothetical protein